MTLRGHAKGSLLIVDGDEFFRALVAEAFERAGFVTRQAPTGEAAIDAAREERPAAVLLDVILSGATGYEICRELKDEHGADLPVVFVTGERKEPADKVVGLLIGGDDYLVKPVDTDELIARVRRLTQRAWPTSSTPRGDQLTQLTPRESKVLGLLAEGLSANQIAGELVISPKTVATHVQRILRKLGVHSRTQAVALAYESGFPAATHAER
jgi:DNA-binding NarL/FixJ family response regulator